MHSDERTGSRAGDGPAEEKAVPSDDRSAQAEAVLADSDRRQEERSSQAEE